MASQKTSADPLLSDVLREYAGHSEFSRAPTEANARGADNSILNIAAYRGNLSHVRVLLAHGADIDAAGDMGNTPLHDAVSRGHIQLVEYLLEQGASVSPRNEFGKTALEEAVAAGFREIAALIRKTGR